MIYKHKLTGNHLEFIRAHGDTYTLFLLDKNLNRILYKNWFGKTIKDVKGNKVYSKRVCRKEHLLKTSL